MIISIIYLIISLFLETIMSNFFPTTLNSVSLFTTMYTIIGLVIIYPFFNNRKKYYLLTIIFGCLFGILYGSGFIVGLIIFLLVGMMIRFLYNVFPENVFMTNLISYISICIYHLLSFIILSIFSSISYSFMTLINILLGSIVMTIIYTSISYYVLKFIFNKKVIK